METDTEVGTVDFDLIEVGENYKVYAVCSLPRVPNLLSVYFYIHSKTGVVTAFSSSFKDKDEYEKVKSSSESIFKVIQEVDGVKYVYFGQSDNVYATVFAVSPDGVFSKVNQLGNFFATL